MDNHNSTDEPENDDRIVTDLTTDDALVADDDPSKAEIEQNTETLLEQMGGLSGVVYSTVPVLVFAPVNSFAGLKAAIIAALVSAVLIFVWRLWKGQKLQPAISGFIGVIICAYIAYRVGGARGYFLWGIWVSLVYAGIGVLSIVIRWPLVGVVWNLIDGRGHLWRKSSKSTLYYDIATAGWVLVFAARYIVQKWLYDSDLPGWLTIARIGMGWPLTVLAVALTVIMVRKANVHVARIPQ